MLQYWSSSAVIDNFKAALIQDLAAAANVVCCYTCRIHCCLL
jgi:hypothetical protein